jgi:hypothetical protein
MTKAKGMNLGPCFTPCTKLHSKWIKDLNVRSRATELFRENISVNLHDLGLANTFLAMIPKTHATKGNIDQLAFIKMKKLCASNDKKVGEKYLQITDLIMDLHLEYT